MSNNNLPSAYSLESITSQGVVTPEKWAAQFISDLSLHIVNEDYEALEEIKRRSDEIGGVRATLLVNFGEGSKHNRYGLALKDEGTTHGLLMQVLQHLTKPPDHVAWCRYLIEHDRPTRIVLCDSDEPGAFKVYRSQT